MAPPCRLGGEANLEDAAAHGGTAPRVRGAVRLRPYADFTMRRRMDKSEAWAAPSSIRWPWWWASASAPIGPCCAKPRRRPRAVAGEHHAAALGHGHLTERIAPVRATRSGQAGLHLLPPQRSAGVRLRRGAAPVRRALEPLTQTLWHRTPGAAVRDAGKTVRCWARCSSICSRAPTSLQPRRGLDGSATLHEERRAAGGGAGHQLRPPGPHALRARDAAARVRPDALHALLSTTRFRSKAAPTCSSISPRRLRRCWKTGSTTRRSGAVPPSAAPSGRNASAAQMIERAPGAIGRAVLRARQLVS